MATMSIPLIFTTIALQAMLIWPCGRSQELGFLSIDCGSQAGSAYTDDSGNGIQWISDANLINEGTPMQIHGTTDRFLSSMRLFDGNHSKYCYSLTNTAVEVGAFFMVRALFYAGNITPPYTPKNSSDNNFRFKLIVDANEWMDVVLPYGSSDPQISEVYVRAQRSSIDVCLARITPDGGSPFISALELRPLPSTLTTTKFMAAQDMIFLSLARQDFRNPATDGPRTTRYPFDSTDRIWTSFMPVSATGELTTDADIDESKDGDQLPTRILQDSVFAQFNSSNLRVIWSTDVQDFNSMLYAVFHFAEINTRVNASGQRVFNIEMNGGPKLMNTEGALDVFAKVGANAAYSIGAALSPSSLNGSVTFDFVQTGSTSERVPAVAAGELFHTRASNAVTSSAVVSVVELIKTSLGLSSYTGDPCLPTGYGYSWLNCSANGITALSLSNYGTGHEIPGAINELTTLTQLYLDGNSLQGGIPDLSALANLETLDLRNNSLSGSIPSFFATLNNLKALYLQNNKLSGVIPAALLQRKQASLLKFEFSGNPDLCESSSGECSNSKKKKSSTGIIVGVAVAGILLVGIAIGMAVYCSCRKRPNPTGYFHSSMQQELPQASPVINMVIPKLSVQEFSFQEIRKATNNFHTQLGQGGFGPVYKGCLEDGRVVAIKVASNFSHQGSKEFLNEVDLLSRVHHTNLVELVGFCNDEKLVLVYDFMSNGSLFDCLHGPFAKASPLSWAARLRIIVDAAQGLHYLHDGCKPRIIHRDVKSSNILVSGEMDAKISDFGISRDYSRNETGAPPTTLMGSMGYMDPEYISNMKLTERVDVYSFGMLLFEVVCGRTTVFKDSSGQQQINIGEWAKASINCGVIEDIVDVSLDGQYDASSVWKVLDVALACVEMPSFKRPKMSTICHELSEAYRMELARHERNPIEKPSIEFTSGSTFSYTQVTAR